MSVATPLCSGRSVSASRRLGGARLCCCGDVEHALSVHHFSHRAGVFLTQRTVDAKQLLQQHFYYTVRAPLGVLLADESFLAQYARNADRELYAVTVGTHKSPDECAFAWLPDGNVFLSVDSGTYAQLGVQAPQTPRFNARSGEVSSGRRFIQFNVRASSFKSGKPLHDALIAALVEPRANPLCFLLCCTDHAGNSIEITFPDTVVKSIRKDVASKITFQSRTVLQPTRDDVIRACFDSSVVLPDSKKARTDSEDDSGKGVDVRDELLKWVGLCVACPEIIARDTMSLTPPDSLLEVQHVKTVEEDGCLVLWDGFFPASTMCALYEKAQSQITTDKWGCVLAWGIQGSPVCWKKFEHEELMGQGENDVFAFLTGKSDTKETDDMEQKQKQRRYGREIAFLTISAHDEFSGI